MASLSEQSDLECLADSVRLLVNEVPDEPATATPSPEIIATADDCLEPAQTSQLPVPSCKPADDADAFDAAESEQPSEAAPGEKAIKADAKHTSALDAVSCLKGSVALFSMTTIISMLAFWPSFILCPHLMPARFWAYNLPEMIFNAGIYSGEMCLILGLMMGIIVPLLAYIDHLVAPIRSSMSH
jgi:hypothetical protein